MKLSYKAGSTSKTINVFIQDSASTTGTGKTGIAYNAAGLTAYYALQKAAPVAITLATLAAVTTAWTSGGFIELDATNMPGWYRLDVPNAALASGECVGIHIKGASGMAPLALEIALLAIDPQDAVRGGMTALPNAAAAASGGLPTVDANNSVKIQGQLKKGVALSNFHFLMTDSATHNPATGKTVTATRLLDNGTFGAGTLSAATEVSNGVYRVDLGTGDTNGNTVTLRFTASGCDDLFLSFATVA